MKHYMQLLGMAILTAVLIMTACYEDDDSPAEGEIKDPDIEVTFKSAYNANGTSGVTNTTGLILSFDADPVSLTLDDITVSGASKVALSGDGTLRYLAISKITVINGTAVSVTISNPKGYSIKGSPKSAVVYREPHVGMPYQGGVIAYILQPGDPGYVSGETHGLIAAHGNQSNGIRWCLPAFEQKLVSTSTAYGTGSTNTENIIKQNGAGTSYAAGIARAHNGGGYTDWYLPSFHELKKIYDSRHVIHGLSMGYYWSSSADSIDKAYLIYFPGGYEYRFKKYYDVYRVRAVRTF